MKLSFLYTVGSLFFVPGYSFALKNDQKISGLVDSIVGTVMQGLEGTKACLKGTCARVRDGQLLTEPEAPAPLPPLPSLPPLPPSNRNPNQRLQPSITPTSPPPGRVPAQPRFQDPSPPPQQATVSLPPVSLSPSLTEQPVRPTQVESPQVRPRETRSTASMNLPLDTLLLPLPRATQELSISYPTSTVSVPQTSISDTPLPTTSSTTLTTESVDVVPSATRPAWARKSLVVPETVSTTTELRATTTTSSALSTTSVLSSTTTSTSTTTSMTTLTTKATESTLRPTTTSKSLPSSSSSSISPQSTSKPAPVAGSTAVPPIPSKVPGSASEILAGNNRKVYSLIYGFSQGSAVENSD